MDDDDDRARAHEDHSATTPHERLCVEAARALVEAFGRDDGSTTRAFTIRAPHEHWRTEAYACEVRCDARARGWPMGAEGEDVRAVGSLLERARAARGTRAGGVEFTHAKRKVDSLDHVSMFDAPCALFVRAVSASGRFADADEATTVRAAFTQAMSALDVGDAIAVVTPRGYDERDFTGDVCDRDHGDAVLETDVTRFTRFSGREENAARTFSGCVSAFLKQVRDARVDVSTRAIEAETKALEQALVSARLTFTLRREDGRTSTAARTNDDDSEDERETLVGLRRQNAHENIANSDDFGLCIEEWDDECPWARWVNVEDPWLSLELDALWLDEPFDSMCGFSMSDLEVEDAKIWSLRGELTQAARDRGEDEDEFISSGTTTLSELIYARAEDAIFVRATDGAVDTASLAGVDFWRQRDFDVLPLPSDTHSRGIVADIFTTSVSVLSEFEEPLKSAPANSLISRFALHACLCKNARAVANLWNIFVRELRQKYWERGRMAPGIDFDDTLGIDHGACVLHQKLQLINQCIVRRNKRSDTELEKSTFFTEQREKETNADWDLAAGGWSGDEEVETHSIGNVEPKVDGLDPILPDVSPMKPMSHPIDDDLDLNALLGDDAKIPPSLEQATSGSSSLASKFDEDAYASADEVFVDDNGGEVIDAIAEGISRTLKIRMMQPPHTFMCAPVTQAAPLLTEDMLAEREAALRALGDDEHGRAARQRAQSDSLISDMSAFKAANPRATFEDFVRWYSPKDWVEGASDEQTDEISAPIAPRGHLSERMRHDGNVWAELWKLAPRSMARDQKLLFDPIVEGEKALHYLETIPAAALLDHVVRCACAASLGLLFSAETAKDEAARDALRNANDACSSVFAREGTLTLDDYDFPLALIQVAERTVHRAESLRVRAPSAPMTLVDRLLRSASDWERARAKDFLAASSITVKATCETPAERAYVAALLAKSPYCSEYAVAASPTTSDALPGHRLRVVVNPDHTRVSRRIAVAPFRP